MKGYFQIVAKISARLAAVLDRDRPLLNPKTSSKMLPKLEKYLQSGESSEPVLLTLHDRNGYRYLFFPRHLGLHKPRRPL